MVQSLPGFLDLCLDVCSPCQVLGDVYTEVLEAAHPLHRGPTDHKRKTTSRKHSEPQKRHGFSSAIQDGVKHGQMCFIHKHTPPDTVLRRAPRSLGSALHPTLILIQKLVLTLFYHPILILTNSTRSSLYLRMSRCAPPVSLPIFINLFLFCSK